MYSQVTTVGIAAVNTTKIRLKNSIPALFSVKAASPPTDWNIIPKKMANRK